MLERLGRRIALVLGNVINLLDPSLVLLGGSFVDDDTVLAAVTSRLAERGLPLTSTSLEVARSPLSDQAGLVGASCLVADALFDPTALAVWLEDGHPTGRLSDLMHDPTER